MRRYETFLIIDPDLSEDQRVPLIGRVEDLITQMDGFLIAIDDWGERKLAYNIKKKGRGYYVRFDFCGLAPLVNEIERFFRIDDRALKYMTVLLNADPDLDKIKEEKAVAAAEAIATQESSDPDNAAEKDQEKELAPAEEQTKTDEEVPTSETEDPVAEKTPSSTIEEA